MLVSHLCRTGIPCIRLASQCRFTVHIDRTSLDKLIRIFGSARDHQPKPSGWADAGRAEGQIWRATEGGAERTTRRDCDRARASVTAPAVSVHSTFHVDSLNPLATMSTYVGTGPFASHSLKHDTLSVTVKPEPSAADAAPAAPLSLDEAVEHAQRAFALKQYESAVDFYATALEIQCVRPAPPPVRARHPSRPR